MASVQLMKGLLVAAVLAAPAGALAEDLTLRRVALSTGGLGYFEYETEVVGDATVSLDVPLDQVDDVLKSLVVYDDTGRIGTVSLPGRQPLAEVFRDLPFDQAALRSPAALLQALAGAELRVTGPQAAAGRILSVAEEQSEDKEGRVALRTRVTLLGPRGMSQFVLEQADSVAFADPALDADVNAALMAMAQHGERDRRVLTLTAAGEGRRTLRVAYVVGVPLWKTSYRLTLPEASGAGQAGLQGWAVLENQSGEDWSQVELSLVSGNPVAFRQALYESYYLERPEVPVQVVERILPPVDRLQVTSKAARSGGLAASEAAGGALPAQYDQAQPVAAPPAEAGILEAAAREGVSQAIFRFPFPVTVQDGHSLLVPFVDRSLPVERLSYFQPGVSGDHPLASLRLRNEGETSLPPGIVTLYERGGDGLVSYLGDARLGLLPAGESRLVSFALDGKVTVETRDGQQQQVTGVTVKDGVMTLRRRERLSRTYSLRGAGDAGRLLLLQEPRRPGWTLVAPESGVEESGEGYRLALTLAAGETKSVTFVFERPLDERVFLADMNDARLAAYLEASYLPEEMKRELRRLAELKATLAAAQRTLARLESEESEIVSDQGRLRENLTAVPSQSDLGRRYLGQLSEQEDRLEALRGEARAAQAQVDEASEALRSFLGRLTF